MTDTDTTTPVAASIEKAAGAALAKVKDGSISLKDLMKALAPAPERVPAPTRLPLPAKISDSQRAALERLNDVFGKVVPIDRRMLQPVEVTSLLEERATLDEIAAMAEDRKTAIRTTVFNHLDVLVEQNAYAALPEEVREQYESYGNMLDSIARGEIPAIEIEVPLYDKDGHYVVAGEVRDDGTTPKRFTREVSDRGSSLSAQDLEALEAQGEITHEDYLSMTTQIRTLDEAKVMLHLRANPNLVHAIAKAAKPGSKVASMFVRKA